MDITNFLQRIRHLSQRYILDMVNKIRHMFSHKSLDFIVFFLSQLSETDMFSPAVLSVFFSRYKTSIYHTIYHTREISTSRVLITPEVCHCLHSSSLGDELFDNTKLQHGDIALCKKYLFNKNMNSMTRFHEGLKKIHHLCLCYPCFFIKNHNTLLLNSLDIKYYLQEIF